MVNMHRGVFEVSEVFVYVYAHVLSVVTNLQSNEYHMVMYKCSTDFEYTNFQSPVVLLHRIYHRYDHIANALMANDFHVFSHDMQGHGRSGGVRGHVKDYRYIPMLSDSWFYNAVAYILPITFSVTNSLCRIESDSVCHSNFDDLQKIIIVLLKHLDMLGYGWKMHICTYKRLRYTA